MGSGLTLLPGLLCAIMVSVIVLAEPSSWSPLQRQRCVLKKSTWRPDSLWVRWAYSTVRWNSAHSQDL